MAMGRQRKFWKKLWYFIWEDNSVWSWIVNIGLAFLIIRLVFYPGLGFALGTTHPVVAVVSSSMEHRGSFDDWWGTECCTDSQKLCIAKKPRFQIYSESYGISREEFREFDYRNGFNKGDIMVLAGAKELGLGDIIVYTTPEYPEPIIHRIIRVNETSGFYSTRGDNNCNTAGFEEHVGSSQILGKAVLKIPLLGWIKVIFIDLLKMIHVI